MSNTLKKTQWLWVMVVVMISLILAAVLLLSGKKPSQTAEADEQQHGDTKDEHAEEKKQAVLSLSSQQMVEYGIQLAQASRGEVAQSQSYPAKLVVNTDQQAHVTASFPGRVEQVAVALGQQVRKGQALASVFVPELVDQQANLSIAQENLKLAQQDYLREKQLLEQGISARQDYQRAYNAYRQAQISVQATQTRLSAMGASAGSRGRYVITAPLSGVISQKDVVVGEQVQPEKQLFTIDQLDQLWIEFILPSTGNLNIQPNQEIQFKSLQTGNTFKAQIQSLTAEADSQTGRLQVRAKVMTSAKELRPNLMVNVLLQSPQPVTALRVMKSAIQEIGGKQVVFVAQADKKQVQFVATPVQLGVYSSDGQWVEVKAGLNPQQQYVSQGSFLLKSELEKGEAEHGH